MSTIDLQSAISQANLQFDPKTGLLPAIIQDVQSKRVLMLAYMNEESLQKTLETGTTWFWSRSRQQLWNKGESSGHVQCVVSVEYDCDADTLLVQVDQTGAACHEGTYSCFTRSLLPNQDVALKEESQAIRNQSLPSNTILQKLVDIIAERDAERPDGAYTTYLFEKGLDKILKKVGEETTEVVIAAKNQDKDELRYEVSDLIYHLLVLLRQAGLPFEEVLAELSNRHDRQSTKSAEE